MSGRLGIYSQAGNISSIDPDAQAYITAGSITDATEIAAINQMFLDLKGTGSTTSNSNIYSKFSALYLMSPTSLAAAAINAVTPSTYDITWYNSPTHSVNGVVGNGSNQYGDTGLNAFSVLNQNDCGITVSLNTTASEVANEMGVRTGTSNILVLLATTTAAIARMASAIGGQMIDSSTPFNNVYTMIRRGTNDAEMYREGVSVVTSAAASSSLPNETLYILGENITGSGLNAPSTKRTVFNAVHQSFTDNEAKDLYDAITNYNSNVISGGR